jgi:hypothetical protein
MLAVMNKKHADYDVPHKYTSNPVCSCLCYFALKLVYHSTHFKFFVLFELLCVELFKASIILSRFCFTWNVVFVIYFNECVTDWMSV